MKSKFISKIFLLSFFVSFLFVSPSQAQWWVKGGNLIWPYGNVTVEKNLSVNGVIKNIRYANTGEWNESNTIINDSLRIAGNFIPNSIITDIQIDGFTAKNKFQNGNINIDNGVWFTQSSGNINDEFSISASNSTIWIKKTTNDTIPFAFANRSRIFTNLAGNYLRNYYGYYTRADAWQKLNIENAYNFYSDGTSFSTNSFTTNLYHFYGLGDYPSYFGGVVRAKSFQLNALNTAPANASDTGTAGEIRVVDGYIYVCVASNTWKRAAITTW